jgi:hypothetical protein
VCACLFGRTSPISLRNRAVVPLAAGEAPPSITVTAYSPGLGSASVTLATSVDPQDAVLAVAAASVQTAYLGQ